MVVNQISDQVLIRQFQDGDNSAYDELVGRYSGQLFNFIFRIIGDRAFAEDLLQETFIRLWLNKDSYREIAKFSTWIYTIAGNLAKTELRRQKVRRWLSLDRKPDERPFEIADKRANPSEIVQTYNTVSKIESEIQKLPVVFREVIILRDIQELSYDEIGTILKIPLGTVKSRLNRGRSRLQKELKKIR